MGDATFDLDASTAASPNVVDSVGGMVFTNKAVSTDADGMKYWDLDSGNLVRTGGGTLLEGQFYTHAYILKWRVSNSGWRTLLRHTPDDHCAIVRDGALDLGMYSNGGGGFRDSYYDINPQRSWWDLVVVTGHGTSTSGATGTTTFYTLDGPAGSLVNRGTADRVCSGNYFNAIGLGSSQAPGLISRVVAWPRVLQATEIQALPYLLGPRGGVCQSVCASVCLSICLPACLCVCLSTN